MAIDAAEWIPPGRKIKVKFLLVIVLKAESSQDFVRCFTERWLGTYPKPRVVLMDSAKSLISETTHQYLSDLKSWCTSLQRRNPGHVARWKQQYRMSK